eukprot:gene13188-biopygen9959
MNPIIAQHPKAADAANATEAAARAAKACGRHAGDHGDPDMTGPGPDRDVARPRDGAPVIHVSRQRRRRAGQQRGQRRPRAFEHTEGGVGRAEQGVKRA